MVVAAGTGGVILIVVALVIVAGVVYGYYTRRGSGIEPRRWSGDGAPGAEGEPEVSGKDQGEGSSFDTHGTR